MTGRRDMPRQDVLSATRAGGPLETALRQHGNVCDIPTSTGWLIYVVHGRVAEVLGWVCFHPDVRIAGLGRVVQRCTVANAKALASRGTHVLTASAYRDNRRAVAGF